jgi:hypothetical protein
MPPDASTEIDIEKPVRYVVNPKEESPPDLIITWTYITMDGVERLGKPKGMTLEKYLETNPGAEVWSEEEMDFYIKSLDGFSTIAMQVQRDIWTPDWRVKARNLVIQKGFMKALCIYHGNCADGFGAAWAVRHALGDRVEFHLGFYQDEPPDVVGRDVIIVDFSYKLPVLKKMLSAAKSVTIIDHHQTAEAELNYLLRSGVIRGKFDGTKSGAMLAWEWFNPGKEPPMLIKHIQDRDLWKFELPGTREIQAAVFSFPYDFDIWDKLMATDITELQREGVAIERKHFKDIDELLAMTQRRMSIGGYDVPVANLPYTLSSDAGNKMAKGEPFAACYYDTPKGRFFSLRSVSDGGLDVSAIAEIYGGGGHKHAAGFMAIQGWEGEGENEFRNRK